MSDTAFERLLFEECSRMGLVLQHQLLRSFYFIKVSENYTLLVLFMLIRCGNRNVKCSKTAYPSIKLCMINDNDEVDT
jgi:hypothetical protein